MHMAKKQLNVLTNREEADKQKERRKRQQKQKHISLENIKVDQVFKSYSALCKALDTIEVAGNSKQSQLKNWKRYFSWDKEGNKFIIKEIYKEPKPKIDGRVIHTSDMAGLFQILLLEYMRYCEYGCIDLTNNVRESYIVRKKLYESIGLVNHKWETRFQYSQFNDLNERYKNRLKELQEKYQTILSTLNISPEEQLITKQDVIQMVKYIYDKLSDLFYRNIYSMENHNIISYDYKSSIFYEVKGLTDDAFRPSALRENEKINKISNQILKELYQDKKIASIDIREIYAKKEIHGKILYLFYQKKLFSLCQAKCNLKVRTAMTQLTSPLYPTLSMTFADLSKFTERDIKENILQLNELFYNKLLEGLETFAINKSVEDVDQELKAFKIAKQKILIDHFVKLDSCCLNFTWWDINRKTTKYEYEKMNLNNWNQVLDEALVKHNN